LCGWLGEWGSYEGERKLLNITLINEGERKGTKGSNMKGKKRNKRIKKINKRSSYDNPTDILRVE
jgi:hypothetical protein